ncbi:hypothetical protein LshimejAT787_0108780 [Lyophyllum shimeji]|uniref:Uncharacterized protein n=1 Tax=Lyophyllum shimeji TaxID=47721 RepID=A0A9P3PE99_LYOSH|nr:hypothetical protein LshimejAT787_0108780 [Lyophyllum shimeji]
MTVSELQTIREEVATCAAILARVEGRLREHDSRQQAFSDLERERAELAKNVKLLTHQKEDLERKFAQQKPDADKAIEARNAAFRKLRYARKVIRDLVDEQERQLASKHPSNLTEEEEREEMKRALKEAMAVSVSSNSSSSDSEGTARQQRSPLPAPKPTASPNRTKGFKGGGSLPAVSPKRSPNTSSSAQSSSESVHPALSHFAGTDSNDMGKYEWSIHYSSPPGSSVLLLGPVDSSRLLQHRIIAKATVDQLASLGSRSDSCLRLHTSRDLAFLYDPFLLEGRSGDGKKTYILDWGVEEANRSLEAYLRGNQTVLHTFIFPAEKKQWFYVGAHTWKLAKLPPLWPSLGTKSRRKVVHKLVERSHGEYDEETIQTALERGDLRQLCIEISSVGHWEKSENLARKMGYKDPRAL